MQILMRRYVGVGVDGKGCMHVWAYVGPSCDHV
jgi:hypothetical protein